MRKAWWATGLAVVLVITALVACWAFGGDIAVGRVSSVMTAIGLTISVYVALAVTELRRRYVRQGILKSCQQRLARCSSNLKSANPKKNSDSIVKHLTLARRVLEHSQRHLPLATSEKLPMDQLQ
jgi:type VI protein secretion system component VasK